MLQITMTQTIARQVNELVMRGPQVSLESAKAHMLGRLVKGIPVEIQVDMVINNVVAYTLDFYSVTP